MAPDVPSPAPAPARLPAWVSVHLGHVFIMVVLQHGFMAAHHLLFEVFQRLNPESAGYAFTIYDPWIAVLPRITMAVGLLGWIPLAFKQPRGIHLRHYLWFLLPALIWRRLRTGSPKPRRGTYWKHPVTRERWLLLIIKAHFLPIAIGTLIHASGILAQVAAYFGRNLVLPPIDDLTNASLTYLFPYLFFLVDALVATFAYSFESRRLGCGIRAVETRLRGWLPCLICYPPMLLITQEILTRNTAPEYQWIHSPEWLQTCQILSLGFFGLYTLSSVTLGVRYSNLSYRGTTGWGPFALVRHPQYATKLLSFFFEWLPYFASFMNIVCFLGWIGIYAARALTEEQFLSRFKDYRDYREKVKWRFIPGLI